MHGPMYIKCIQVFFPFLELTTKRRLRSSSILGLQFVPFIAVWNTAAAMERRGGCRLAVRQRCRARCADKRDRCNEDFTQNIIAVAN